MKMLRQAGPRWDVAIVGGGPAGCAAALTLAKAGSVRCVLIEREVVGQKPGEVVPPGIDPLLDYLQIDLSDFDDARRSTPGVLSAWGSPRLDDRPYLVGGSGPGWHLDRPAFESRMRDQVVERGTALVRAGVRVVRREFGTWKLDLSYPAGGKTLSARFVIDATGRAARIGRGQGAAPVRSDRLVAAWRILRCAASDDPVPGGATLVETGPAGWWYSAGLPDGHLAAAYFTDSDLLHAGRTHHASGWGAMLATSRHTRRRLSACHDLGPISIRAAHAQRLEPAHGADWIACGDAALAFDPVSSAGIAMAILTGIHAARVAVAARSVEEVAHCGYSEELERHHAEHLRRRSATYLEERRWLAAPFWSRRQSARTAACSSR